MSFHRPLYFCQSCRRVLTNVTELLFVEENEQRGFCSENCINSFYSPLMETYSTRVESLRAEYGLLHEEVAKLSDNSELLDQALKYPDEVWCIANHLGDKLYSFIKHQSIEESGEDVTTYIALCNVYEGRPSFVYMGICTQSKSFVEEFRFGEEAPEIVTQVSESTPPPMSIPEEDREEVALLKSTFLAELLEVRNDVDIPMEDYELYSSFCEDTLLNPDEVYQWVDDQSSREVSSYIKAHQHEGVSFYYLAVVIEASGEARESEAVVIPIITFPTIDSGLLARFRRGKKVHGQMAN